jgi:hypothetical protein
MNQFIRCIACDEVFAKTPFDQWPEYEQDSGRSRNVYREIEKDDFDGFLNHHRNHPMENLEILEDSFVSEKPYSEPTKVSYVKATNGKERFVIKKFREKIDEPLTYQLIHGDYFLKLLMIQVQSEEIIKQLHREINAPPLPRERIEAFLKLYQQIVKNIDVKNLERIAEDSSHPLEIYYKMDDVSLAYLLRNCRSIFDGREYKEIDAFIHRNKEDGVLLLKATYQIRISESAWAKKKETIPVFHASEEKKYVEKK